MQPRSGDFDLPGVTRSRQKRSREMTMALLASQDKEMVKPIWPSLLQGPIFVDHPSGQPQKKRDDYILWDN